MRWCHRIYEICHEKTKHLKLKVDIWKNKDGIAQIFTHVIMHNAESKY